MKMIFSCILLLSLSSLAQELKSYTVQDVKKSIPLKRVMIQLEGQVTELEDHISKTGMEKFYHFNLAQKGTPDLVSVSYYYERKGKLIADKDLKNNDWIRLKGEFSHVEAGNVIGNLEANLDESKVHSFLKLKK